MPGSNGFIVWKTILSQGSRGGPTFSRVVQLFPEGGGGWGVGEGPNANFNRYPYNF